MRKTCVVTEVGEHIFESGCGNEMGTSHKSEVVPLVPTNIFESSSKKLGMYGNPYTSLTDESVEYEAPCSRPISGDSLSVGLKRCVAHFAARKVREEVGERVLGRRVGRGVGRGVRRGLEGGVILKYYSFSQDCVKSFL